MGRWSKFDADCGQSDMLINSALVTAALTALRKGGKLICAGIHMSDIPCFPYRLLWGERSIQSIANLTRRDAE
jgi:propanol-preferring alcohol dehydrogenase